MLVVPSVLLGVVAGVFLSKTALLEGPNDDSEPKNGNKKTVKAGRPRMSRGAAMVKSSSSSGSSSVPLLDNSELKMVS